MPGSPELTSLWRPLRVSSFRNLIIADVVSDVGAFMQSTGAAWLMVSLNAGPMYVALTQTASALPFFLFALPAGAIGDIVDRRKLILYTETWMAGVALVLAALTIGGLIGPLSLLILTFAVSTGDAFGHHHGALCYRIWSRKRTFRRRPPSTASNSILRVLSDRGSRVW